MRFPSPLCVRVKRDGNLYEQRFERGRALGKIDVVGEARGTGTFVHFVPDADIFESVDFDADLIRQRLEVKKLISIRDLGLFLEMTRRDSVEVMSFGMRGASLNICPIC